MELLTLALTLFAFFIAIKAIQVFIVWTRLLRCRFRRPHSTLTAREALPAEMVGVFQSAEQQLTPLGFRYSHSSIHENILVHDEKPQPAQLFLHEDCHTYAEVTPTLSPEAGVLFNVSFITELKNGRALVTVDCQLHDMSPCPHWCRFADYYVGNLERQWQEHQRRIGKALEDRTAMPCSPDAFIEYNNSFMQDYMTENALLTPASDGNSWRLRPLPALGFVWDLLQGMKKRTRVMKATQKAHKTMPDARLAPMNAQGEASPQIVSEVAAFERTQEIQRSVPGWSWLGKCALLLVSVAVAAVSFGLMWSWSFVPVLIGVLFFHELGHWFGMRIFDYRDRQMFFIPFLGAAVTGEKEDATPMQQIIVLLLGPVPGLMLGMVCLQFAPPESASWLNEVGWMAVSLNYLNLLPISPFDGGRVVELLLSRFPWIRFAFGSISVVILLLLGLTGSSLMLGVAIAVGATLLAQWRVNVALRRLHKLGTTPTTRPERLHAIFQVLTHPPFHQHPSATRYELAKTLLRHLTTGPATWRTMFAGGTVYAVSLLVPLYIGVKTTIGNFQETVATMDPTHCVTTRSRVKEKPLQEILSEEAPYPTFTVLNIVQQLQAKLPCDPASHTYVLTQMTEDERLLWDLHWFNTKFLVVGFHQFFENDGEKIPTVLAGLERIGATQARIRIEQSLAVFPNKRLPETPDALSAVLRQIEEDDTHQAHALWEQLEHEYAEQDATEVANRLITHVHQHLDQFPPAPVRVQASSEDAATPKSAGEEDI